MSSVISTLRLKSGEHITKDSIMTEVLNDYFDSVFTIDDIGAIEEMSSPPRNVIPLSNCDFTEDIIIKVLDNIRFNKTSGTDRIAPDVFKETKKSNL